MPGFLVDTNVRVCAIDPADPTKRQRRQACIAQLGTTANGALSAQVLGEFFVIATRKVYPPLTTAEAERLLTGLVRAWPVYDATSTAVLEAIRGVEQYRLRTGMR